MHLICVAESLPETYPKFVEWMQRQSFGHGSPVVREMKILDINMPEKDMNEFCALLQRNISFFEDYTRHGIPQAKLEGVCKWARRLLPVENHGIQIDTALRDSLPKSFPLRFGDWVYMYPIGKLKDNYKDGVEWI